MGERLQRLPPQWAYNAGEDSAKMHDPDRRAMAVDSAYQKAMRSSLETATRCGVCGCDLDWSSTRVLVRIDECVPGLEELDSTDVVLCAACGHGSFDLSKARVV